MLSARAKLFYVCRQTKDNVHSTLRMCPQKDVDGWWVGGHCCEHSNEPSGCI